MVNDHEVLAIYRRITSSFTIGTWETPLELKQYRITLGEIGEGKREAHSPTFTYDRDTVSAYHHQWLEFYEFVRKTNWNSLVRDLVLSEVAQKLHFAEAINQSDHAYNIHQHNYVGYPSDALVSLAYSILTSDSRSIELKLCVDSDQGEHVYSAREIAEATERVLGEYGLHHWGIEISGSLVAKMAIDGANNLIRIYSDTLVTKTGLRRLLVHEIGGHVFRWENSRRQLEPWVSVPLGNTLSTEEGFALWRESQFGVLSLKRLRIYAARVVAVHLAKTKGIIDVFKEVLKYVDIEEAISIAIRVKRGLVDPNEPGGKAKDWGYLGGLIAVNDAVTAEPDIASLLAVTKWSLESIDLIRELKTAGRIQSENLIPSYEVFKSF